MSAQLSAELGHLARPAITPYNDVRMTLLDAMIAANAAATLEQEVWEQAFASAMRSLRVRVIADAETALRAAAAYSRYPARRLRATLPDAEAADTLLQRLLAEGMALERFEGSDVDAMTGRARAAALDAAWEGAVRVAAQETARWRGIASRIAAWRRDTLPLWIITGGSLALALLLAVWLSGISRSPAWFRPINDFWWRLWP